jgi:hypothetical protein
MTYESSFFLGIDQLIENMAYCFSLVGLFLTRPIVSHPKEVWLFLAHLVQKAEGKQFGMVVSLYMTLLFQTCSGQISFIFCLWPSITLVFSIQ